MSLTNLDSFLVELEMDLAVLINAIKASSSSLVVNRIYFKELNERYGGSSFHVK
jgi:hypothetical protein